MWSRRLAELCMIATESVALFVLAAMLAAWGGDAGPSFLTVAAAMLGGFYLVRFLLHFDAERPSLIAAGIGVSLVALLVLLNVQYGSAAAPLSFGWLRRLLDDPEGALAGRGAVLLGIGVVAATWLRGTVKAQHKLTYQSALTSWSIGLLVVVLALLFGQGSRAAGAIDTAAVPYLVLGLLTLALAQLGRAQRHQGNLLRGPWAATLVGTVLLLAAVGALVGLVPLGVLNALLAPVGALMLWVFDALILVIALPIALLIQWLVGLLAGNRPFQPPQNPAGDQSAAEQLRRKVTESGPPWLLVLLGKVLFLAVVTVLVAYIAWWAFHRLRRPAGDADETRESLESEGGLGADLGALLGGLLGRFRRAPRPEREPALPEGVLAVRRLYVRALRRAEEAGVERPPAATPAEFAPALAEALQTPAAYPLSDRFAAARYGLVAPSREELRDLEREVR